MQEKHPKKKKSKPFQSLKILVWCTGVVTPREPQKNGVLRFPPFNSCLWLCTRSSRSRARICLLRLRLCSLRFRATLSAPKSFRSQSSIVPSSELMLQKFQRIEWSSDELFWKYRISPLFLVIEFNFVVLVPQCWCRDLLWLGVVVRVVKTGIVGLGFPLIEIDYCRIPRWIIWLRQGILVQYHCGYLAYC